MVQYFPVVTGSLTVTGSINVSGGITASGGISISGSIASASFASTASFVALAQSASNAVAAQTASFANAFTVAGNLTAQTLVVQTITSSVDFVTGSTRFGSISANTHVFTGSMSVSGAAIFSEQLTATSPSTLFKEGFIVKATTTGGGGSQPAYTYYTAAGSKRWSSFLNVGDDKLHIANALNSEVFTIIQSGSVGIGTTDPLSKSHTVGSSTAVDNSGIMQISTGTVFASNKLIFGINDGNYAWIQAIQPDVAYRNLVLQSGGGNVLIGSTTNPGQKLYVAGDIRCVRLFPNSGGNATDPIIAPSDDTNNGIFFPSADTFAITTAGTERFRIASTGAATFSSTISAGAATFSGKVIGNGFNSYSGDISIASGATSTIYTMGDNGLYTAQIIVSGGSLIYSAAAIFYSHVSNAQFVKAIDLYDGANVTLDQSAGAIRITNNGFATLTWAWSVLYQRF
jgi:hypothetical protein